MKMQYMRPVTVGDAARAERCARGTVAIIDDDPLILEALSALLSFEGYACDTFSCAQDYLDSLDDSIPRFPGPRCVLCDVHMPSLDGLALQACLANHPEITLVLMSGVSRVEQVVSAFRAGASDFLLKPIDDELLFAAIAKALRTSRLYEENSLVRTHFQSRKASLNKRELEVIVMAAHGRLIREIADELGIAERTVKLYKQRASEKLGLKRAWDLVRLVDQGLL